MNTLRVLARLPTCCLGVRFGAGNLIEEITFLPPEHKLDEGTDAISTSFRSQITHYLNDPTYLLHLPLLARGSTFQQRVWHAIRNIPAGQTRNYGDIAAELGSAARAVGQACGANPFPLITPCHRVMAKTGIGGFAHAQDGWLIDTKHWLLQHEGAR